MRTTDIVVGIDGSRSGRSALRWAAAEAGRRSATLRILFACEWRWLGARFAISAELEAASASHTAEILAAAVAEAKAVAPGITVTADAVPGSAAKVLLDASQTAALVVVGSRGHGGFTSLLLGSTSQQVATHASAPVVVVRGRGETAAGPVVAAVDGTESAEQALGLAFSEAHERRCALMTVRAYTMPTAPWGAEVPPVLYNTGEYERMERQQLERSLQPWRDRYPEVPIETVVRQGNAAKVLTGASASAQLVVLGTGHGGVAGVLLSSVGLQVLYHADCPVLVAHCPGRAARRDSAA